MQLTRQQIIDYLQTNRVATAIEISRALQVTAANIRHHLKILKVTGLVETVGSQPSSSRGRPHLLYSLTENALKQNLDGLASALLQVLLADKAHQSEYLRQVAIRLIDDDQPVANRHARLSQGIEQLNRMQYQASWEASPTGPRVIFRNCPYAVILNEHPELCQLDAALISELLGRPFQQIAKLERRPSGIPHCAFVIRNN